MFSLFFRFFFIGSDDCHEQERFWGSLVSKKSPKRHWSNVADQFGALSHDVFVLGLTDFLVAASYTRYEHIEHRQVDDQYGEEVDDESNWGRRFINENFVCKHCFPRLSKTEQILFVKRLLLKFESLMIVRNDVGSLGKGKNSNDVHQNKGKHLLKDRNDRSHKVTQRSEHSQVVQQFVPHK